MNLPGKLTAGFLGLAMAAGTVCTPVYAEAASGSTEDNAEFNEFLKQEFIDTVSSDYLTLHYTLKNPEAYGIEDVDPALDPSEIDDYETAIAEAQASLDQLHSFDYDTLSDTQQHDYDAYETALEETIELNGFENFDWYFLPSNSIYDNLTTNLTEFEFRSVQDFEDYLTLLHSIPAYLEKTLELTEKQAEAGYFMTDTALSETLDGLDKFTEKTEDNELIILFDEKADAFADLSDAQREQLKEQNRDAVLNEIIPVYSECSQTLQGLAEYCTTEDTLTSLKGWKEYYAALARQQTSFGEETTVEDLLEICEDYLNEIIPEYVEAVNNPELDDSETVRVSDPMEILEDLSQHLQDYPEIGDISYQTKYLDPSVANDSIIAYYLNPPIDDASENQIKINDENVEDVNHLYFTLAHEGLPGHMYQENYYLSTEPNEIRTQLSTLGYTEGWAMYAQTEAMQYSGLSADYAEYYGLENALNYVLNAIADLGVNGLGWTAEELNEEFQQIGLDDLDYAESLHAWVTENPGVIISYGVGIAEFMLIRYEAEDALGSSFNLKEFNTVVLNNGPRTFESVRTDVENWIASKGGSITPSPDSGTKTESSVKWYAIAAAIAAVLIGAAGLLLSSRSRRKDPFEDHEA